MIDENLSITEIALQAQQLYTDNNFQGAIDHLNNIIDRLV